MALIKLKSSIDKGTLLVALVLFIMPGMGLFTGTAFSMGIYGSNYQEFSLVSQPDQYWFIIKWELMVVGLIALMAILEFPAIDAGYQKILAFRQAHKVIAYAVLYLLIPIAVVAICLGLLLVFDL